MVDVLDALLLVFIFVELLYAVRTTLKERQIVAEPFLIAGILTAMRRSSCCRSRPPTTT
ncbi:MAG: phosphate-starvation-inducible PsiE family protein [Actinomycetota bacterium]|nr:phosphate-starvation-inducible PsiE family protein [Actinomycetota bacterium]